MKQNEIEEWNEFEILKYAEWIDKSKWKPVEQVAHEFKIRLLGNSKQLKRINAI